MITETIVANLKAIIITLFMLPADAQIEIPQNVDCDILRSQNEQVCLACNMYHEARGETHRGKVAVAMVTRNRVDSDRRPDDFCSVVWERKKFSWTHDGKSDRIYDKEIWEEAFLISTIVVGSYRNGTSYFIDETHGSMWYHADWQNPDWASLETPITHIGGHKFYIDYTRTHEIENGKKDKR